MQVTAFSNSEEVEVDKVNVREPAFPSCHTLRLLCPCKGGLFPSLVMPCTSFVRVRLQDEEDEDVLWPPWSNSCICCSVHMHVASIA